MKNILTEALVNSATNASFIFSYTNSAKLRVVFWVRGDIYESSPFFVYQNMI